MTMWIERKVVTAICAQLSLSAQPCLPNDWLIRIFNSEKKHLFPLFTIWKTIKISFINKCENIKDRSATINKIVASQLTLHAYKTTRRDDTVWNGKMPFVLSFEMGKSPKLRVSESVFRDAVLVSRWFNRPSDRDPLPRKFGSRRLWDRDIFVRRRGSSVFSLLKILWWTRNIGSLSGAIESLMGESMVALKRRTRQLNSVLTAYLFFILLSDSMELV